MDWNVDWRMNGWEDMSQMDRWANRYNTLGCSEAIGPNELKRLDSSSQTRFNKWIWMWYLNLVLWQVHWFYVRNLVIAKLHPLQRLLYYLFFIFTGNISGIILSDIKYIQETLAELYYLILNSMSPLMMQWAIVCVYVQYKLCWDSQ